MKKIAIYGAGGLGREMSQMVNQINADTKQWELVGFYDDNIPRGEVVKGLKVLGGIGDLNMENDELNLVIGIADNNARKNVISQVANSKITYPNLIHPSVMMDHKEINMGEGSIITAGNILTTDIQIGKHCIINLGCTVGHDVYMEDFCMIMPGVHLSGNITVRESVFVGTGARILQNLSIGKQAKVGAGAVVIKDVPTRDTVVGVPASTTKKS